MIKHIDASTGIAVGREGDDFRIPIVVEVTDSRRILSHATHQRLRPKHIALPVDDIDLIVMAKDDFVRAILIQVRQSETAHGFVSGIRAETQRKPRHGSKTVTRMRRHLNIVNHLRHELTLIIEKGTDSRTLRMDKQRQRQS